MILKTKEYSKFKLREDNRAKGIDSYHVDKLVESIKSCNMLDLRPICVNTNYEIIDGQHRLEAAKRLGIDIYYQVEERLDPKAIIRLNVAKSWTILDYLNFYVKNGFREYLKLEKFIKENQLPARVAINICIGRTAAKLDEFRNGDFIFSEEVAKADINICWGTIETIERINGKSIYCQSAKFWQALIKLINQHNFSLKKWQTNLTRFTEKFRPQVSADAYYAIFLEVHNYKNSVRIPLDEE